MTTHPQPADAADERAREVAEEARKAYPWPRYALDHMDVSSLRMGYMRQALADAYRTIESLERRLEKR